MKEYRSPIVYVIGSIGKNVQGSDSSGTDGGAPPLMSLATVPSNLEEL
jgi:hypothetical protein